ncbi:MAG: thioredoxin domain-containing protein [Acidobacteria bacterium]|nr:thioredoxin domain-containing protein [Acidobacteriota bacterium]
MKKRKFGKICGWCLLGLLPPALGGQTPGGTPALARVGGQAIYEGDLMPAIGGQLMQLRNQEYDLKMRALISVVNQRLLESEAKKAGLSTEAFLAERVDRQMAAPGEGEIKAYYLAQKERINRPFEEVKAQVNAALVQAKLQQARQEFIDRLRGAGGVSLLLDRPRVDVTVDPARLRGDAGAAVTIVEFSDFQCPYCKEVQQVVTGLLEKYKGKVRLGYRDFPLRPIHPQAQKAAEASRCAGEQGKFWEYHDLLYQNQTRLDNNGLAANAQSAGLDAARFGTCLASAKFAPLVESDLQAGIAYGVSSTPTFYVQGVLVVGGQSAAVFENLIDAELTKLEARKTAP